MILFLMIVSLFSIDFVACQKKSIHDLTEYLLYIVAEQKSNVSNYYLTIIVIASFFIAAITIFAWIVVSPKANIPRRVFGCLIDNYGATASLFINGDLAAPILLFIYGCLEMNQPVKINPFSRTKTHRETFTIFATQ